MCISVTYTSDTLKLLLINSSDDTGHRSQEKQQDVALVPIGMCSVPMEMVLMIFEGLEDPNDKLSFLQTCSQLHDICIRDLYKTEMLRENQDLFQALTHRILRFDDPAEFSIITNCGYPIDKPVWDVPLLIHATEALAVDCTRHLLERGANTETRTLREIRWQRAQGDTALHSIFHRVLYHPRPYHAAYRRAALTNLLLEHGADVNAVNNAGETPLFAASEYEPRAVRIMIRYGADVNARTQSGETVLHRAARRASPSVVETLVLFGADINAVDNQGRTPLHVSLKYRVKLANAALLVRLGVPMLSGADGKRRMNRVMRSTTLSVRRENYLRKIFTADCWN